MNILEKEQNVLCDMVSDLTLIRLCKQDLKTREEIYLFFT